MKVSEILQVKGNILYTITPDQPLVEAANTMAEKDIGSLVVMEYGDLVGMLTFREVLKALHANQGSVGGGTVRLSVMKDRSRKGKCKATSRKMTKKISYRLNGHIGTNGLFDFKYGIAAALPQSIERAGTPEAGGLTSRELLRMLRALADRNIVGADIVEVAPAYDHAQLTAVAASHVAYELLSAMAPRT